MSDKIESIKQAYLNSDHEALQAIYGVPEIISDIKTLLSHIDELEKEKNFYAGQAGLGAEKLQTARGDFGNLLLKYDSLKEKSDKLREFVEDIDWLSTCPDHCVYNNNTIDLECSCGSQEYKVRAKKTLAEYDGETK